MPDHWEISCSVWLSIPRWAELSFVVALFLCCVMIWEKDCGVLSHIFSWYILLNKNAICHCRFASRFSLPSPVIFWVSHGSLFFRLSVGIDKQIPRSPFSLLFLCIFSLSKQPANGGEQPSECLFLPYHLNISKDFAKSVDCVEHLLKQTSLLTKRSDLAKHCLAL